MFAYVARQPIVDTSQQLYAYELLFRDGEKNCFPDISPDEATSRILAASHLNVGLEAVTNNALAFINFHTDTLLYRFPTSLDPASVVIEITETVEVSDELVEACAQLKAQGYRLALDDYDLEEKWQALLPLISIVKFDVTTVTDEQIRHSLPILKAHNIELVAERIEDKRQFEYYKELGFDYFQGYFFAKPEVIKHRKMSSSASNMLELLKESSAKELSLANINAIMERDVSLSYLLLRFINNPTIEKRNEITSLRHAMTFMGEQEVRKFIALLSLANLSDGKPEELLSMSLVRARFCELILQEINADNVENSGFLTGMLSLLNTLMQQDMRDLVNKLPLPTEVSAALCGEDNQLRQCLQLAVAFERGQWGTIRTLGAPFNLAQKSLHNIYVKAITWAAALQNEVHQ